MLPTCCHKNLNTDGIRVGQRHTEGDRGKEVTAIEREGEGYYDREGRRRLSRLEREREGESRHGRESRHELLLDPDPS